MKNMTASCATIVAAAMMIIGRVDAATLYVKMPASGSSNCTSWADGCTLAQAFSTAANGDQIWVKAGNYTGGLTLPNGVKIIGGFAGTETLASQSNPATNVTTISAPANERAVYSIDSAQSTVLRGFTVKNGTDYPDDEGGGGVYAENSSAVFVQCTFENNSAQHFGGAVMIKGTGSPNFVNCIFRNNGTGAGSNVSPLGGGAAYVHSGSATFTNCLFHGNRAGSGGAIMTDQGTGTVINCTLTDNFAERGEGGAIYDEHGLLALRNTIVWNNHITAGYSGPQMLHFTSMYAVSVTYGDVEGGFTGVGNIAADPTFLNAGGADFKLAQTSPCRDVGSNSALPPDVGDLDWDGNTSESLPKDLAGQPRKFNFTVDMGAYESSYGPGGGGGGGEG
jgi:predicted outer membrane repeat protein